MVYYTLYQYLQYNQLLILYYALYQYLQYNWLSMVYYTLYQYLQYNQFPWLQLFPWLHVQEWMVWLLSPENFKIRKIPFYNENQKTLK